ncbi:hypothetical protein V2A60_009563 [Cordyceps javanica]
MPLCQTCQSIPFGNLPPFPKDEYRAGLSGLEHVHPFSRRGGTAAQDVPTTRVRHHASLEGLGRAAADGCELCVLIRAQADALLAELETPKAKEGRYSPPDFDMWLTQRCDGGQGFWVWSAPTFNSRAAVLPVAAFAFVVSEDHPLAGTIRGRPVAPNIDPLGLRPLIRWNEECDQHPQWYGGNGPMPSRLIDLKSSSSENCVEIIEPAAEARHQYAALSYDSESATVSRWENRVLAAGEQVDVDVLPKMFQDAISVTRTLGIRHLFIDALCVPNHVQEWARDSEQFASAYKSSHLTLSATGSEAASDGLFPPRPARALARVPYPTPDDAAAGGTVSVCAVPLAKETNRDFYVDMATQPLSRGVWSFQERVLSRRTVHFASDQMYFECMHFFASEDGLRVPLCYHSAAEAPPAGTEYFRKRAEQDTPSSRWFAMLFDYGPRQSRGDGGAGAGGGKLAALANVARAYRRINNNDDYVAGHWKDSLLESLCWQALSEARPSGQTGAPSWSWASIDGIPATGFTYSTADHFPATVLGTRVMTAAAAAPLLLPLPDAPSPSVPYCYGDVTAAEITLEAPLVALTLVEKPGFGEDGHMFLRAAARDDDDDDDRGMYAAFDTIDRRFSQSAAAVRRMPLFAMPLACTRRQRCEAGSCHFGLTLRMLLVTPAETGGGGGSGGVDRMRRVGYVVSAPERFEYERLGSRQTVVLV